MSENSSFIFSFGSTSQASSTESGQGFIFSAASPLATDASKQPSASSSSAPSFGSSLGIESIDLNTPFVFGTAGSSSGVFGKNDAVASSATFGFSFSAPTEPVSANQRSAVKNNNGFRSRAKVKSAAGAASSSSAAQPPNRLQDVAADADYKSLPFEIVLLICSFVYLELSNSILTTIKPNRADIAEDMLAVALCENEDGRKTVSRMISSAACKALYCKAGRESSQHALLFECLYVEGYPVFRKKYDVTLRATIMDLLIRCGLPFHSVRYLHFASLSYAINELFSSLPNTWTIWQKLSEAGNVILETFVYHPFSNQHNKITQVENPFNVAYSNDTLPSFARSLKRLEYYELRDSFDGVEPLVLQELKALAIHGVMEEPQEPSDSYRNAIQASLIAGQQLHGRSFQPFKCLTRFTATGYLPAEFLLLLCTRCSTLEVLNVIEALWMNYDEVFKDFRINKSVCAFAPALRTLKCREGQFCRSVVANCSEIENLIIGFDRYSSTSSQDFDAIGNLKSLHRLQLRNCVGGDLDGLGVASVLLAQAVSSSLRVVQLMHCSITSTNFLRLPTGQHFIEEMVLSKCNHVERLYFTLAGLHTLTIKDCKDFYHHCNAALFFFLGKDMPLQFLENEVHDSEERTRNRAPDVPSWFILSAQKDLEPVDIPEEKTLVIDSAYLTANDLRMILASSADLVSIRIEDCINGDSTALPSMYSTADIVKVLEEYYEDE